MHRNRAYDIKTASNNMRHARIQLLLDADRLIGAKFMSCTVTSRKEEVLGQKGALNFCFLQHKQLNHYKPQETNLQQLIYSSQ